MNIERNSAATSRGNEKPAAAGEQTGGALAAAPCSAQTVASDKQISDEPYKTMIPYIPSTVSDVKGLVHCREGKLSHAGPENGILHWRSEPPVSKEEIETLESYCGKLLEPYPLETQVV